MASPLTRRESAAVFIATGIAVLAIVVSFLGAGYFAVASPRCPASGAPTVTINSPSGQPACYYYEDVHLTAQPLVCPFAINQSWSGPSLEAMFYGVTFHLARYTCGNESGIAISIQEANGNVTFGATQYGESEIAVVFGMFTTDGQAGVMATPGYQNQNATLCVETGP